MLKSVTSCVSQSKSNFSSSAKNIILAGVKSVTLHDTEAVHITDLGSHFYLSESDVGKNRAEACCERLASLNSAVAVKFLTKPLSEADLVNIKVFLLHIYIYVCFDFFPLCIGFGLH